MIKCWMRLTLLDLASFLRSRPLTCAQACATSLTPCAKKDKVDAVNLGARRPLGHQALGGHEEAAATICAID
eukprot:7466883-Pyramimonas_sp.AAC.1